MFEVIRALKIYGLDGKPFDRVEKGARCRQIALSLPSERKMDVQFNDGRMFMIPKRWLIKVKF